LQVDPENALERTNKKFIRRFTLMEQEAKKQSRMLHNMTLEEMDDLWNNIKNHE
jgi:XTP/dITP diphosphohydrolase